MLLREAGYRQRADRRELVFTDSDNEVEFFFLRPRDIAIYVGSGDLDLGITGRDLLLDSEANAEEVMALDFARSTFCFAALPKTVGDEVTSLANRRIATAYPGLVRRYLAEHEISATVIRLDGAVETAIKLGVADVIADVVDTGSTLRQQGLELVGSPVLVSEAVLVGREGVSATGKAEQLSRRLQGVLVGRRYVMLAYDVRAAQLDSAVALTPGIEAPTVSPLHRSGWVAVQAMVLRTDANHIMDALYDLGARAILSTDIRTCRI